MSAYRRLGLLARLAHFAFGFLDAHALLHSPQLGAAMLLLFLLYEFAEWIHDVVIYKKPYRWDFPDEELAEAAAGMAAYAALSLLHLLQW